MKPRQYKKANNAQIFLLENNLDDLILNDRRTTKPKHRIYTSDAMMEFKKDNIFKRLIKWMVKKDFELQEKRSKNE